MDLNDLYKFIDERMTRTEDRFNDRMDRLETKYDAAIAGLATKVEPVVQKHSNAKFMVAVVGGVSGVLGSLWAAAKLLV